MAELVISIVALTVSVLVAWHTIASRSYVHARVSRTYGPKDGGGYTFRGDDVIVFNTGRADAVLVDISVVYGPDDFRSPRNDTFPDMPVALPAQSALRVHFPAGVADLHGGKERGYRVQYFGTRWLRQSAEPKTFITYAARLWPSS